MEKSIKQVIEERLLINLALKQIKEDIAKGDLTAIEELLKFVPNENLKAYIPDDAEIIYAEIKLHDTVLVPEPNDTDIHSHEFLGTVIGFRDELAQVEDGDGDVFDIEIERLTVYEED